MEGVVMPSADFWVGKRVFLTGHTGFKGAWLSLWLQQLGASVTGYALEPNTNPNLFASARVADGMTSLLGDVRDAEALAGALAQSRAEIVIHMAAQPLVRYGYENPVETYSTNVMGLVHLFEAVRAASGVRAMVNVTSDKCYENREVARGYREDEAMGGYDPYSSSKGCAELITSAYRRSYFNPGTYAEHGTAVASARAGNVIGGGDWSADRLIPDIMRAIVAGAPGVIRNPHAVRPWQHVLEPLRGYLLLCEKLYDEGPQFAEGWNFGPAETDARPVEWIADHLTSHWGGRARWTRDGAAGPHEARFLKLDSSKARTKLGWKPIWPLPLALQKIVEWHKAFDEAADMRAMTTHQIENFQRDSGGRVHHEQM